MLTIIVKLLVVVILLYLATLIKNTIYEMGYKKGKQDGIKSNWHHLKEEGWIVGTIESEIRKNKEKGKSK